jgi:hypothetical protein
VSRLKCFKLYMPIYSCGLSYICPGKGLCCLTFLLFYFTVVAQYVLKGTERYSPTPTYNSSVVPLNQAKNVIISHSNALISHNALQLIV